MTEIMECCRRDDTPIDIADVDEVLVSSISNSMSNKSFLSSKCSIFKIPKILYRFNEEAYVPNVFSIGPLHHGEPRLKDAESIKLQYLCGLISRAPTRETSLKNFIEAIRELEGEARECYAIPVDFSVDEFVKMLVIDGCFIIELLRKSANEVPKDTDDPVFNMSCMFQFLYHDLILLENQIPWLVLDHLFNMTKVPHGNSLTQLVIGLINASNFSMIPLSIADPNHGSKHILDLLRNMLVWPFEEDKYKLSEWTQLNSIAPSQLIPSVTSLVEAGIKLKMGKSQSMLNIKFDNGVLEIPPFLVQEITSNALGNLISFEQCYHNCTPKITSYGILLQFLIGTTKDINILHQHGITQVWLYPEEAIKLFNNLFHETYVNKFYYLELCDEVNEYCSRTWPRLRALYMHHFTNPWAIVSQVVGGILLVLTFLQTYYSIKK